MMLAQTRRSFIATGSKLAAGLFIGVKPISASSLATGDTPAAFLGDPIDVELLKVLAAQVIETARSAGVSYADVRLGQNQRVEISLNGSNSDGPGIEISSSLSYGIRALVNGSWGFVYGNIPTTNALVSATQRAVSRARAYSKLVSVVQDFAPIPVVTGDWVTPVGIAPLRVPILDQVDRLGALNEAYVNIRSSHSVRITNICQRHP